MVCDLSSAGLAIEGALGLVTHERMCTLVSVVLRLFAERTAWWKQVTRPWHERGPCEQRGVATQ